VDDFADRLRRLREARGWTQYRLSKLSGLSWPGVRKLEEPGSDPLLSTLVKLAAALGVQARELMPEGPAPAEAPALPKRGRPKKVKK
jgi:transcriptional regulator with XRE-family HTH domain